MFHHYICEKWNYKFRRHEIYDKRFNGIIGTVRLTHTASVRVVSVRVERVSVQRPPRHPPPPSSFVSITHRYSFDPEV